MQQSGLNWRSSDEVVEHKADSELAYPSNGMKGLNDMVRAKPRRTLCGRVALHWSDY